ncbi:MAG: polyphosphate polymerase domain-containing protein [Faecalibacterium sp.]
MAVQSIFKRYELKYKLTPAQHNALCEAMQGYMQADEYGRYLIRNVYFDTADYQIIRQSIEKPTYKEKLRLRQYGMPEEGKLAFIELKKKYNGVVYKRRVDLPQEAAVTYLWQGDAPPQHAQILDEIDYFKQSHPDIRPRVYLSYEREAYFCPTDENFRLTFDYNIKTRDCDVSLAPSAGDKPVLRDDSILMEVKIVGGLPLWFTHFLSEHQIYKTSFSKYGTAYTRYSQPHLSEYIGGFSHAI